MLGAFLNGYRSFSAASGRADIPLFSCRYIIVCGYGLFKSNISCLLGELFVPEHPRRDVGSLLYAAGNIGSIRRSYRLRLCARGVQLGDGLALAAIGMLALVIFLCGNRHFTHTTGVNSRVVRQKLPAAELGLAVNFAGSGAVADTVLVLKEWFVYFNRGDRDGPARAGKIYRQAQNGQTAQKNWG